MRLIVMENVIKNTISPDNHLGIFDLKGSRSDRFVEGIQIGQSTTMKDQNLIELNKKYDWLRFSQADCKQILRVM